MSNITLSISDVTSKAWELAKKHGLILAVVIFAVGAISQSIGLIGFPWGAYLGAIAESDTDALLAMADSMGAVSALSIVGGLLSIVATAGIINIVLKLTRGTMKSFDLEGFKMPFKTYANFVGATIISSIIICIGTILCIIPGIFLAARLSLVPAYLIDHPDAGVGEAFNHSWEHTKGNFWNLFGLGLVYVLFCIVGLLCCCVGVYFAQAIGYFMITVTYFTLCGEEKTPECAVVEAEEVHL